jgi:hypothetical protein
MSYDKTLEFNPKFKDLVRPQIISTHKQLNLNSIMITQGQPITHSQTLPKSLASLDTRMKQVFNDAHAMVKL